MEIKHARKKLTHKDYKENKHFNKYLWGYHTNILYIPQYIIINYFIHIHKCIYTYSHSHTFKYTNKSVHACVWWRAKMRVRYLSYFKRLQQSSLDERKAYPSNKHGETQRVCS